MRFSHVSKIMICCLMAAAYGFAQEVKDPNPPTGGGNGVTRGPGPDAFGYVFDTTVPYSFTDISGTGTPVVSGDDVSSGPIALPAPFNFYGTNYTSLVMASNSYISTDPTDTGPDLSNDCPLPSTPSTGGGARMYPLHDDTITGQGYYEYFAACPRPSDRFGTLPCHIFQWDGVTHFGGGGPWQQQAILYEDAWDIVFQIGPGNPETGSGSTTGIQNDGATIGLTVACNTAGSIPDNFAVAIYHPMPEVCTVTSCSVENNILTLNGDCDSGADLWAQDLQGNNTLVQAGLSFSGSVAVDVSAYPDSIFFLLPPGGDPLVDTPIFLCDIRTVPTLSNWALIALLSLLAVAGLFYMRRKRATA